MKAKLIAIAALAALSAGTAQAITLDDGIEHGISRTDIEISTKIKNDVKVVGSVYVNGSINVGGEAGAAVSSGQSANNDDVHLGFYGTNKATVGGNALENANGNVGVNVAAGAGNVQSNDVALAKADVNKVFAWASADSKQRASFESVTLDPTAVNKARMDGNALAGAKGNIGVNIAAGAGNVQENALATAVGGGKSTTIAKASVDNDQRAHNNRVQMNSYFFCWDDPTNSATLGGNALRGAVGNIGVNIAAGAGNLQHNALAVATSGTR